MANTPKPKPKTVTKAMQQMEKKIRKSSPPLKYENTRPAAKAQKLVEKTMLSTMGRNATSKEKAITKTMVRTAESVKKNIKAASKMTPRESATRKIASSSLAARQSANTTGMWSNDNPRGQKVPKAPKYKDPTKIKGFAYGKRTQ